MRHRPQLIAGEELLARLGNDCINVNKQDMIVWIANHVDRGTRPEYIRGSIWLIEWPAYVKPHKRFYDRDPQYRRLGHNDMHQAMEEHPDAEAVVPVAPQPVPPPISPPPALLWAWQSYSVR
jgi:hypothetical protein